MTLLSRATVQTKNLINYSFEAPVPKKPCEPNFLNHSSAIPLRFTLLYGITAFIFGMMAPQYAVKSFSLQCALALAFNLVYLLTFFVA